MIDYRLGNVDVVLDGIPDETVQVVVTSPPYYGLRDYGGGKEEVGQEDTPDAFVARLVAVFRKVRRVLRKDGVLFLNLGDSWCSTAPGTQGDPLHARGILAGVREEVAQARARTRPSTPAGLKPKDMIGIPWRVALALQADGWYLRQDLIWSKTACMPESVTDRFTKSHEYIFLLSKSERYFFDHVAVREPVAASTRSRLAQNVAGQKGSDRVPGKTNGAMKAVGSSERRNRRSVGAIKLRGLGNLRSRRSVLVISPKGFKGAHFAVYPPEIPEIAIKAGTSAHGACASCGAPWRRRTGRPCKECGAFIPTQGKACGACGYVNDWKAERGVSAALAAEEWSTPGRATPRKLGASGKQGAVPAQAQLDQGWESTCRCATSSVRPCVALDPFGGSGTTSLVAERLGRDSIYIDLNPDYLALAIERWGLEP